MSGGAQADRFRGAGLPVVTAGDPLPTAAVIMSVKQQAARVCAARAADCAWPDLDAAKAWIEMIPYVALGALGELCLDVHLTRLARCVGLDPIDGPDDLAARKRLPGQTVTPISAAIETVVLVCGGGR